MKKNFYIIMGVSGSGKSSVGQALAASLGWEFYDADDFHSPENIVKMASGISLTDHDRAPWLITLHTLIRIRLVENRPAVLTCSALKERYRQILLDGNPGVRLVYLKGNYQLIWERMQTRSGHYMKADMLKSQFDDLEEPKNALVIDAELSLSEIVLIIRNHHETNTTTSLSTQKKIKEHLCKKPTSA
jgi:gluconokinase